MKALRLYFLLILLLRGASGLALQSNLLKQLVSDAKLGYERRVSADPTFPAKSVAEVMLAAGTQLAAEFGRRGPRLIPELDFVLAGVLTAIFGKYYSMWRVAPTRMSHEANTNDTEKAVSTTEPTIFQMKVPTNAFQMTMLDGVTRPSLKQRLGSFVLPVVPLFKAGVVSSAMGYGLVRIMILLRSLLVPSYVSQTQNINVLYASLYTGAFLALVSNIRYQVLQGVIEPCIDKYLRHLPFLQAAGFFTVRTANGLLGSTIAIAGMKWLGLQRLK